MMLNYILKEIKIKKDSDELQIDIHKTRRWSKTWKMKFITKKCHVLGFGIKPNGANLDISTRKGHNYKTMRKNGGTRHSTTKA